MKEYNKLLLTSCMAVSKVIIMPHGVGTITTVKNITKEKIETLINQHLLGQTRLGITPEILGQEDKVSFGAIDIDCPDISDNEKYVLASNMKNKLLEEYGLVALIEISKSKGFHVYAFFSTPQKRSFIKNILQDVVNNVTDRKITNGQIEVFPKGDKGNAIFLPFFGMFKDQNTFNEEYFKKKKSCFVKGHNMKIIKNPLEAIYQAMRQNDSILPALKKLSIYPECVRKAFFAWKKVERHYLTMALAAILKKISKVSESEAINIVKSIAQFNQDEEINDRINAVKSTYKNDDVAGCSIMQGRNENIVIANSLCAKNCELVAHTYTVKGMVKALQCKHKGLILKEKIAELIKDVIDKSGKIYKSNCKYYLFLKDEKHLITLTDDSRELKTC